MSCILNSDLLSCLKLLPDNSFDGVFCDPPYELGFMGKSWDSTGIAFCPETWAEVLRVCKPGAHLLAFGGSRTFHRLVCAVEDAGWEIRDVLMYLYGSGFPKSLNVSKALDKLDAAEEQERRRLRFTGWVRSQGVNACQIDKATGTNMGGHYTTAASQPAIMTREHLEQCRHLFRDIPAWVEQEADKRSVESENFKRREVIRRATDGCGNTSASMHKSDGFAASRESEYNITAPATESARLWDGYGTALKPAYEPVVLARKPLDGTVAQNVLQWGCGALWIDGGRIEGVVPQVTQGGQRSSGGIMNATGGERGTVSQPHELGRWPANALHDGSPEVLAGFPVTGPSKSGGKSGSNANPMSWNEPNVGRERIGHNDNGGSAARFFYCAKASQKERNAGCDARNIHPTVKPLDLCRYLATLILPPADRPQGPRKLLVPFSGSGSEMTGALLAGWDDVTGIEREAEYVEIAKARLSHHSGKPPVVLLPEWLDL